MGLRRVNSTKPRLNNQALHNMFLKVSDNFDIALDKQALRWTIDYQMNDRNSPSQPSNDEYYSSKK